MIVFWFDLHVVKGRINADFVFLLLTLAWLFGVYLFSPNTEPNKFGQGETQCSKAQGVGIAEINEVNESMSKYSLNGIKSAYYKQRNVCNNI